MQCDPCFGQGQAGGGETRAEVTAVIHRRDMGLTEMKISENGFKRY